MLCSYSFSNRSNRLFVALLSPSLKTRIPISLHCNAL
jgi:hypothetical protein